MLEGGFNVRVAVDLEVALQELADPMTPKSSGKKRTPLGRQTLSQCY
jgi:hypothetical protein